MPAAVLERYLNVNTEYHVDAVVVDGHSCFLSVSQYVTPPLHRKHSNLGGSVLLLANDPRREVLSKIHALVIKALGLEAGVTHLEIFDVDGQFIVGEVACRPGGGWIPPLIHTVYGVDLMEMFFEIEIGSTIKLPKTAAVEPSRPVAAYGLPLEAGVIATVTPAAELEKIDGVLNALVKVEVGQEIPDRFCSSSQAGCVVIAGSEKMSLEAVISEVQRVWSLQTEPVSRTVQK